MNGSPCEEKKGKACPNCSGEMEKGHLQTSGRGVSRVYLEPGGSDNEPFGYIPVCVWFCRHCGQILMFADVTDQAPQNRE